MPSHATMNSEIKQLYINGHFCYAYKFGIITNGLGIIRHLAFYDKDFFDVHDIKTNKKSDSPNEDKSVYDARLLIPTLVDFFEKHPVVHPKIFLDNASFDSIGVYKDLLSGDTFGKNQHFLKAYIPLNSRTCLENPDFTLNPDGIPCCPHDEMLVMNYESTSKLKSRVTCYKFVCPKIK